MRPMSYGVRICYFCEAIGEGVDINGRVWRWEFGRQFGPVFIDKRNGDPLDVQPAEKSPAWPVFEHWLAERNKANGSTVGASHE